MTIVKTVVCNYCPNQVGFGTKSHMEWAELDVSSASENFKTGVYHMCPTCQKKYNIRKDS